MQNLISKSELARRAGVNPATITRVASNQFPNAMVGKKIDADHKEVIAYLFMRQQKVVDENPRPVDTTNQSLPSERKNVVDHKRDTSGRKAYTSIAKQYAIDVVNRKIPNGKYIVLACQRFLDDLKQKDSPYFYDEHAAFKVCNFVEQQNHTKGEWLRKKKKLVMEPWQIFFVCNIFGWKKHSTGYRRYREALLMVPRKNGKSQLAAAIALYLLCADDEGAPEVYCGATCEDQADEVFKPAKLMASSNEDMRDYFGLDVRASNINILSSGAKLERLIGNPGDGGSPHGAIVDEYHEHDTDNLFSTMETGTMARAQSLILITTTAGSNLAGPCYMYQLECQKDLDGAGTGYPARFAMIYGIDEGDAWDSVESLEKANPNFGVSVYADTVMNALDTAKASARKQSAYKTKHLNVWVGAKNAYFNVERWKESERDIKLADYHGRRAFIGLDLASKKDIAALEILIPIGGGEFVKFGKYYLPEDALEQTGSDHYRAWMTSGHLTITDGQMIDFNEIKDDIMELTSLFEIVELAYDPFQATMLVTELMANGVPVVEMGATVKNFSEPMKEIDALILSKKIFHNGCPVFTWMLSNVTGKQDKKDNVFPNKDRDENKIDGPVALMMAMGRYMNDDAGSLDDYLNNQISVGF